jgi:hypothetical protein
MLTKEKLLERIKELEDLRDSHLANANRFNGGAEECRRILQEEFESNAPQQNKKTKEVKRG